MFPKIPEQLVFADDEEPMAISELSSRTNTPHRTIHWYVKEGLIPPPKGIGGGALYGAEHRVKLLLIRKLQQEAHLKLQGIRQILSKIIFVPIEDVKGKAARVDDDDLDEILDQVAESSKIQSVMDTARASPQSRARAPRREVQSGMNYSLLQSLETLRHSPDAYSRLGAETWERVPVTDGIELWVRSDVADDNGPEIEKAVRNIKRTIKR